MSLTILIKSKKIRFFYKLSSVQLGVAGAVLAGLVWFSAMPSNKLEDAHVRVEYTQSGLEQQKAEVEALKDKTKQQLTGMLLKLGEMQSQMHRLNALGEKLAQQADLDLSEFNLASLPAIGGPSTETAEVSITSDLDVLKQIDAMLLTLDDKTQQLEALESILLNHGVYEESFISGRPISSGWLSSYYGIRKDPFNGLPTMHKGLDFAGKYGSPVVATGAGIVTWADDRYGYGNLVEVDHGDGFVTRYGHNETLHVRIGDVVTKGQKIAAMGSTGRSTGPHVHYEVLHNGKHVDPLKYVYREASSN